MLSRLPLNLTKNLKLITLFNRQPIISNLYFKQGQFSAISLRTFSDDATTNNSLDENELDKDNENKPTSKWMTKHTKDDNSSNEPKRTISPPFSFNTDTEELTDEQQIQKQEIIKELTRKLSGPLADENGNVPTGDQRPIAIEVDGPSHFYSNSTKYTAYTKLKHRLLTRMGYKVLHVPFFEWRRLRGAREREEYLRAKLKEEPTEWLDPEDEKFYNKRLESMNKEQNEALNSINLTNN